MVSFPIPNDVPLTNIKRAILSSSFSLLGLPIALSVLQPYRNVIADIRNFDSPILEDNFVTQIVFRILFSSVDLAN